jgi:hypothetical protein
MVRFWFSNSDANSYFSEFNNSWVVKLLWNRASQTQKYCSVKLFNDLSNLKNMIW